MSCNFLLMSINVCREWLGNVDIDWNRVNDKTNIDLVCDEDDLDGHGVLATIHYEDGKKDGESHHACDKKIVSTVSGDFSANGIPFRKFVDIVKKTDEKMLLFCAEYGGLGRVVLYTFKPAHRYLLSDIIVEWNKDE